MADSQMFSTIFTKLFTSNPSCLYWLLNIENKNVKRTRGKGYRQQLIHLKHKRKHNIGCYPKSLRIFAAYQVQGWCNMIISPVKSQPYGSNVIKIMLKISWHTHLKHSKPQIFTLQKVKNPPDGFCTHLFFASSVILIFGGILLHRFFRLLKFNLKWIRVPTIDFSRQKCRTRKEDPNSSKHSQN